MKSKFIYIVIALQAAIIISCVFFLVTKTDEVHMYRSSNEELKNIIELEKQKSEKVMLDYYQLQNEFAKCCQK